MDALKKYRAYKEGKLNEAEAHEFERWLLENEDEAMALEGLLEYPQERLSTDVQDLKHWVNRQGRSSTNRPKYYWAAAAAVITVLVVWGSGLLQNKNEQLYDKLYARYQVEDGVVRGEANNAQTKANALYSEEDCSGLVAFMEGKEAKQVASGHLLLGICLMENGEYDRAIDAFGKPSIQQSESALEAVQWYTALCYLRLDRDEQVREIATALVDGKGFYASDAQNLLNALN